MPEEAPITHSTTAPTEAQTAIGAAFAKAFPTGLAADPVAPSQAPPPVQTEATGAPAETGPAATGAPVAPGATGPAPTGATGVTGPEPTTGPSGPAESGASGPDKLSDAALEEAGKKMDIKAGTAFKFVREELAETKKQVAALQAKLKENEGKPAAEADAGELKELKDKVTRYENALAISNVEATDEFQKNIQKPLDTAKAAVSALATKYEVSSSDLAAALADPDANKRTDRLTELSANFNRMDLVRFDQLIGKMDQLSEQRTSELANAAEKFKATQTKRDSEAKAAQAAFQESWKSALESSFSKLEKEGFFKLTGDAEKDAPIIKLRDEAKARDVTAMSNEDLAASLYKAGAYPMLLTSISDLMAENGTLQTQLAALRGATPGAGAGGTPPVVPAAPQVSTMKEAISTRLAGVLPP